MTALSVGLLFGSLNAESANWKVKIKNDQTSEVKSYEFFSAGTYAMEMPELKKHRCDFEVNEPRSGRTEKKYQLVTAVCSTGSGQVSIDKVCANSPSDDERYHPATFYIAEPTSGKKPVSYFIEIACE